MTFNIKSNYKTYNVITSSTYDISPKTPNGSVFIAESSSNSVTFNLPSVANIPIGTRLHFKRSTGSNNVILDPAGTEQIDQFTTRSLAGSNWAFTIISNGTQWYIISFGVS
jgi:hypothetical protein